MIKYDMLCFWNDGGIASWHTWQFQDQPAASDNAGCSRLHLEQFERSVLESHR